MIKRRVSLALVLTLVMVITVVGSVAAAGLKGKVSIWGGGWNVTITKKTMQSFLEANPELEVEFTGYPYNEYPVKCRTSVAHGSGTPDIMIVHNHWVNNFVEAGWAVDLNDKINEDEFVPGILEPVTDDQGHVYGLPFHMGAQIFVYRADVFAEYGYDRAPETLEEYIELGLALKGDGRYIGSIDLTGAEIIPFDQTLAQLGGNYVNEEGQVILDTPEGKGVEAGKIVKRIYDLGIWSEKTDMAYWEAVRSGEIVGEQDGPWWPYFMESDLKEGQGGWGNWHLAKLPKVEEDGIGSAQYKTAYYIVNPNSENQELAWEVVKWLKGSVEGELAMQKVAPGYFGGYIPAVEALQEKDQPNEMFGGQKVAAAVAQILLEEKPPLPASHPSLGEMRSITAFEMMKALADEITVEEAIATAAEKIRFQLW